MNLVQIKKLLFGLFLEELRLEIMFDDRLVTNRAPPRTIRKAYLLIGHIGIFPKGGPYEFSPKLKNYSLVCFWRKYA